MVQKDYFQVLRLQELISAYGTPEEICPVCGCEMMAAEGADQPYYWRCVNKDCFTRGIDEPHPVDGVIRCSNSGCNARVEFGYWGNDPHWRCMANRQHRQKIRKANLRLPKMAALVPHSERSKLCKLLKIENFNVFSPQPMQGELPLFD